MKRISLIVISIIVFFLLSFIPVSAQDNHTAQEEREGKVIWDKLQQKQLKR